MSLEFSNSADKHGIDRRDALNAILNYQYREEKFAKPSVGSHGRPDLFIGPLRDRSKLLEVMAVVTPPNKVFIFHAMEARKKILNIVRERTQ